MQALETYLDQLHSLESNRYYDPLDVIQDLKQVCFNDIPEDQLGMLMTRTPSLSLSLSLSHSPCLVL
jgi:hypothetical protein